jgi:uncharacterized membrane protein
MSDSTDKLVDDYLDRLEQELADFPAARRRELVQEISGHIAEARAALDDETEADVRNLLDRIGDPADIAAEAGMGAQAQATPPPPAPVQAPARARGSGWDVVALVMLLIGALILPVIGWFIGVVLLWISETWSTGEKVLGTLLVPGGLALPLFLLTVGTSANSCGGDVGGPITCTGGNGTGSVAVAVLVIALFVVPIAVVTYLARRRSQVAVPT